jgi:hypothetical protein
VEFERFTVDDSQYPQRPANIPDDYYWDWEVHAWFPPGGPVVPDPEAIRAYEEAEWEEKRRQWEEAQRLKSKDPVSAARALEVPPSWRKSLRAGAKREHLPLFPDDDMQPDDFI